MLKKLIWNTIETTLFYYSDDSTAGYLCFTDFLFCLIYSLDFERQNNTSPLLIYS